MDDSQAETMRQKNFENSIQQPKTQKYGLFSYIGPLAISDNSYDKRRSVERNENGTVKLQERNFYTSPGKKGITNGAYFSNTSYISIGDTYQDKESPHKKEFQRVKRQKQIHDKSFKANASIDLTSTNYHYLPNPPIERKPRRRPEGGVNISPRNIVVSPIRKGNKELFNKQPEYISDPYDRGTELWKAEAKRNKQKITAPPFRGAGSSNRTFWDDKTVYDDHHIPQRKIISKARSQSIERAFFPPSSPKKGILGTTFNKHPEYLPDPIKVITRCERKERAGWKSPSGKHSQPSPSVMRFKTNVLEMSRRF